METENAIIKSTFLGFEDHGFLTAMLRLDFGHSSQGFGGYALGGARNNEHRNGPVESRFCSEFLAGVLETVGVREWSELVGKPVRVRSSEGQIVSIGHIVNDVWLTPEELFDRTKEQAA